MAAIPWYFPAAAHTSVTIVLPTALGIDRLVRRGRAPPFAGERKIYRSLGHDMTIHVGKIAPCEFVFGRGRRTPATLLQLDERRRYLIEAAQFFPGSSDREIARRLRIALLRYREGAWRRTRAEALCPPRHAGRLDATLWCLLRVRDAIPSERTIRAVLSQRHG
jgi:hypothetical protein